MSKQTKTKSKSKLPTSLVWFEIPADDLQRARAFYTKLFGWKIKKFPGMKIPYWHIDTGGDDHSLDGGLMERQSPQHTITNYVMVPDLDEASAKVEKLGGKIIVQRTAVPQMGYFVVCQDTENNAFALWERSESAQ